MNAAGAGLHYTERQVLDLERVAYFLAEQEPGESRIVTFDPEKRKVLLYIILRAADHRYQWRWQINLEMNVFLLYEQ